MLMKILSITSNDLGVSWGPAIHFLELWCEFQRNFVDSKVIGLAPSWTKAAPIISPNFELNMVRVPNIRSLRQVIYDGIAATRILFNHRDVDVVYLRLSSWHILQICAIFIMPVTNLCVEVNGLATEDAVSSRKSTWRRRIAAWQEKWLITHAQSVICVSSGIEEAIRLRYRPGGEVVTIPNGVSTSFINNVKGRRENKRLCGVYVGTYTSWDGAEKIIDLSRRFPYVDFLMVGEGERRNSLQDAAPGNVKFYGSVPYSALPEIYRAADFGIVLYEKQRHATVKLSSLKTLEYVVSKLPVFSTNANGQDFIADNGFGMLVEDDEILPSRFQDFLRNIKSYRSAYESTPPTYFESLSWARVAMETYGLLSRA